MNKITTGKKKADGVVAISVVKKINAVVVAVRVKTGVMTIVLTTR